MVQDAALRDFLERRERTGVARGELTYVRANGSHFSAEVTSTIIPLTDGSPHAFVLFRDLTEQRRTTDALRSSEALNGAILSSLATGIVFHDVSGSITTSNEAAPALLGLTRDQLLGRTSVDPRWRAVREDGSPFPGEQHPAMVALHTGASQRDVVMGVHRPDGSLVWLSVNAQPVREPGGTMRGVVASFFDVTALVAAREELRASDERLRRTLELAAAGVWEWDIRSGEVSWSPESYELHGVDPAETMAYARWERCIHPDDLERTNAAIRDAVDGRTPEYDSEFRVLHPERGTRWILGVGRVERDADGTALRVRGMNLDVTARKRAEEALREGEARFRAMGETLPYGVWLCNPDGGAEYVSQSFLDLLEMTQEEMREFGWTHRLPPGDVQPTLQKWLHCVNTGEMWDSEHRVLGPDGKYHHVLTRGLPVRDESGKITCWVGINLDIDKRKEMEQALLDADRRKDEFLGMLSHELRNPLAPIRNSIYVLRHADPGGAQARRAHDVIERQTEHLTRLVDDLLDVTRIAHGKFELRREVIDLAQVIRRTAEDFGSVMEQRGITFRTAFPDVKLWADADVTRVVQVAGNLLQNAAKFTPRGGSVTLSLQAAGAEAEIRVRDTGAGIDPAVLPHVFGAFVQGDRTLARTDGGLGLGLALVKAIAELHGGSVRAQSAGVRAGAEFVVTLPLTTVGKRDGAPPRPVTPARTVRRVLVVDDNSDAAESLAQIVEMLGHAAEVAFDGPTALAMARASSPDVVLCDLGLPGMSGFDVARALRAAGMRGQIVAISGYAQPEDLTAAVEAGFDRHLAKPAAPEEIERLLG